MDSSIERIILDRLELEDKIKMLCIPNVSGDNANFSLPIEEYKSVFNSLLPWVNVSTNSNARNSATQPDTGSEQNNILSKVSILNKLYAASEEK